MATSSLHQAAPQVHTLPACNKSVWGTAQVAHSHTLWSETEHPSNEGPNPMQKRLHELPSAFKVLEHEDAQPVFPHDSSLREYDETVLKTVLQDAFTVDASVKADKVVTLNPRVAWGHMYKFKERGLVLYFTGKLPLIRDIAADIDAGFGYYAVDKIFYAGNGLFEVLFNIPDNRDVFLSTPTVLLKDQVVHVLPWQPVRIIKDELLTRCPVWVELVDLPSFLWGSIKDISAVLGKVLFSPSINAVNRNKVCVLWNVEEKFPQTLEINVGVGRIVIYLKWGTLSGACYQCGNLGHFTKHCPNLTESKETLIPSYPGSKNLIPQNKFLASLELWLLNHLPLPLFHPLTLVALLGHGNQSLTNTFPSPLSPLLKFCKRSLLLILPPNPLPETQAAQMTGVSGIWMQRAFKQFKEKTIKMEKALTLLQATLITTLSTPFSMLGARQNLTWIPPLLLLR